VKRRKRVMGELKGKIDFVLLISATNANPNGDPLNGNQPRISIDGFGEISDVCIKRKIRNRFQDMGQRVFVQSDDRSDDSYKSLKDRADGCAELKAEMGNKKNTDKQKCSEIACREWIDVRSFGQVFAFKGEDVSLGIRGPVSIHQAVSVSPVDTISMQITKSVNSEAGKESKASDTMGMKYRVGFGLYVVKGSINVQLAEKTGFSQEDAECLKEALRTLFENDASSARPEGSMEVCRLYWWQHNEKTPAVSTARIHRSVKIIPRVDRPRCFEDYDVNIEELPCVEPEVYGIV
jgi:CRISPR-associated protein Csd2